MAIKDKVVTISGSLATVTRVMLWRRDDGSVVMTASGTSSDGTPEPVRLNDATVKFAGDSTVDSLIALALTELRKANGLG